MRRRLHHRRSRAKANDRARWDKLRADYKVAYEAARDMRLTLERRYGVSDYRARMYASRGEQTKLEKLEARRDKIGDKIVALIVKISPRGDAWLHGAPAFWLRGDLTWEDAVRPKGEPLAVVVPAPYGADRGIT